MELLTAVLSCLNLLLCFPAVFLFVRLVGVGRVFTTGSSTERIGSASPCTLIPGSAKVTESVLLWTVGSLSSGHTGPALA